MAVSIAVLNSHASDTLAEEVKKLISETPGKVRRSGDRLVSDEPQMLFDCVNSLVDRVYRSGRRATLGGRGEMSLRAGLALAESEMDALQRAVELSGEAVHNTILADEGFVRALDPLHCLPFERTIEVKGRPAQQTFPPGQPECFVVMPMGDPESEERARSKRLLEDLIRPACRQLNLRPVAPTQQAGAKISVDVFAALHQSSLIVAYLGRPPWNPNVMVEVGYRLALNRPLILIADEALPFDLHDFRAVLVHGDIAASLRELVQNMKERLTNGIEGGDLYPTADIEVDERTSVSEEVRRHRVAAASEATARLFGLPRNVLVGMSPADLITYLGELMDDPQQFAAFQAEQAELYTQLSSMGSAPLGPKSTSTVAATVPLTFFAHRDRTFNGRAFLPSVISQSRRPETGSTQRVVYVEVTHAVRRRRFTCRGEDYGAVKVCELKRGNGGLAFELYARSYDEILNRLTNYRQVRDRHIQMILQHCNGNGKAATVLDVGAGTGNVTLPIAEQGLQVWAIDTSHAMLDRLSQKIAGNPDLKVRIRNQDCRSLSTFAAGSFDAVTMSLVLFASGDAEAATEVLSDAKRILKPGGLLVVTEPVKDFKMAPLLRQAEAELRAAPDWERIQVHWNAVMQANSIINPESSEFMPAEKIFEFLQDKGFGDVESFDAYQGNCWTMVGRKA
jgi:ubiquinone/menaquinone biosynthesis C-methylase UbiE